MFRVPLSDPNGAAPPPLWRRIVFHPLMALPVFIFITQRLGETAYPFSNFPMYSNPADWDDYIYLTDGEDRPIGVQPHAGVSTAKLGKLFNRLMKDHGLRQSAQKRNAPPDVEAVVGRKVLAKAREWAEGRRRPLPEPTRLYRVIVELQPDGTLTERSHLVTEG
jgi:hypothetical protein